jgi:hypothetical protein
MTPKASSEAASRMGRAVKSSGTSLEVKLWERTAAAIGEYPALERHWPPRLNCKPVEMDGITAVGPRLPNVDMWFPTARLAVQAHGCLWHACEREGRPAIVANAAYWALKFDTNRRRDARNVGRLRRAGIRVVTVWEHDDLAAAGRRIAHTLARAR